MNKYCKISLLVSLLFLSGCAGTDMQKKLERFFAEQDNPSLRYKAGGSYFKEAECFYSKKNCDELYDLYLKLYDDGSSEAKTDKRIILDLAEQRHCDNRILEWRDRQVKDQQKKDKAAMERRYKDDLRLEESRRIRRETQEKAAREKRARVLREIRNEK